MTGRSPTSLRVSYSTVAADSVGDFLATRYALPSPVECSLLRRGFNDSFEVLDANGQRYVLRLSCRRTRGEADVASETEFLTYLDSVGVPVAVPVPAQDGALFSCGLLPEGRRPVVLFRHIEDEVQSLGRPPMHGRKKGTQVLKVAVLGGAVPSAQASRRDRINSVATLRCHPRARPNVNDGSPQRQRSRGQCVPVLGLRSFRSPFPRASVSGGA